MSVLRKYYRAVEDPIDIIKYVLESEGWETVRISGIRGTLFDIIAKRDDLIILVKYASNVDSIKSDLGRDLISIASMINAIPIIVSDHSAYGPLLDGVVYSRYMIPVVTLNTFVEYILGKLPKAYSNRGGVYVRINIEEFKRMRKIKNMSLGNVAYACNVSRRTIMEYERGMDADIHVAEKLVQLFGTSIISGIDIIKEWQELKPKVEKRCESIVGKKLLEIGLEVAESRRDPLNIATEELEDVNSGIVGKIQKGRSNTEVIVSTLQIISEITDNLPIVFTSTDVSRKTSKGVGIVSVREILKITDIDKFLSLLRKKGLM